MYGLLAGLAICSKHSIGITLAFIVVISQVLFVKNRNDFKEYFKNTIYRIIGILVPIIILFLYLLITNSFKDFIDYAILGIKTFSNKIVYTKLFNDKDIIVSILSIIFPLFMSGFIIDLITCTIIKKNENDYKFVLMTLYCFSLMIVMYPISDKIHFLLGIYVFLINMLYVIYQLEFFIYNKLILKSKYKICKIIGVLIWTLFIVVISETTITKLYAYGRAEKNQSIPHFRGIELEQGAAQMMEIFQKYNEEQEELGNEVYILDAEASVYMITIDRYNKNYDMFLKGNLGKNGEEGQIETIKNRSNNTIYLIRNKKIKQNWQAPMKVIDYIRQNLEKEGELGFYEIYR